MSTLRINNITSKDGNRGPVISGIATVSSTSHMVVPSGNTGQRITLPSSEEKIVTDGLIALFDAGRPESFGGDTSLLWKDISGNGNHARLESGSAAWSPENGGTINFAASTRFLMDCGSKGFTWGLNGNYSELTVEALYMVPSTANRIHLWQFGNANDSHLSMNLNDGRAIWVYYEGNGSPYHGFGGTDGAYTDGAIRHLTYTYNLYEFNGSDTLGRWNVYMNGSSVSGLTHSGTQQFSNIIGGNGSEKRVFSIGDGTGGGIGVPVNTNFYKVAVYTKELTSAQVLQNYNAIKYMYS